MHLLKYLAARVNFWVLLGLTFASPLLLLADTPFRILGAVLPVGLIALGFMRHDDWRETQRWALTHFLLSGRRKNRAEISESLARAKADAARLFPLTTALGLYHHAELQTRLQVQDPFGFVYGPYSFRFHRGGPTENLRLSIGQRDAAPLHAPLCVLDLDDVEGSMLLDSTLDAESAAALDRLFLDIITPRLHNNFAAEIDDSADVSALVAA